MSLDTLTQLIYLMSTALFILSLKWMNHPSTARRAVVCGVVAMVAAIGGTLINPGIVTYKWIVAAIVVGFLVGVPLSWVPLTAVPQRTALSHAFGGLAAGLVGAAEYYLWIHEGKEIGSFETGALVAEVILGFPDVHRQLDGRRQAPGDHPHPAHHLQGPERDELLAAGGGVVGRRVAGDRADALGPVPDHHSAVAGVRRAVDHSDRRGRHAHRDRPVERLRRSVGRGDGLRLGQQAVDRRRGAGRFVGLDPLDHHVPRDEPLVRQRAVWGVRPGAGRLARGRAAQRQERDGRRRGPDHGRRPNASSSSPATAWRWPRRSTASASCSTR